MAISRRETAMMVGGLLLGIAGAWAWLGSEDAAPPPQPRAATEPQRREPAVQRAAEDSCTFDPVVAKAGKDDGELALETELKGKTKDDVRALLVTGKEAAAAGRPRDAEVAFLMACRAAGQIAGGDGMPLADARYRLGRHYATVADGVPAAKRDELQQRARNLYTSSLQALRAEHGEEHEKTRFAAKGLEELEAQGEDPKPVPAVAEDQAATPKAKQETAQPRSRQKEPVADPGEAQAQAEEAERKSAAAKAVQAKAGAAKAAADKLAQTEAAAAVAAQAQAAEAKAAEAQAARAKARAQAAQARAEAARAAEAEVAQAQAAEDRAEARAARRAERRREARRDEPTIVAPPAASVGQATGDPGAALPE